MYKRPKGKCALFCRAICCCKTGSKEYQHLVERELVEIKSKKNVRIAEDDYPRSNTVEIEDQRPTSAQKPASTKEAVEDHAAKVAMFDIQPSSNQQNKEEEETGEESFDEEEYSSEVEEDINFTPNQGSNQQNSSSLQIKHQQTRGPGMKESETSLKSLRY